MVGLASGVYRDLSKSIVLINAVVRQLHYTTTSRVAPEEKPRISVRRTQETEQQRALVIAETDAEET